MTGLDLQRDALIEIAALVTDGDLRVLGDGVDLVIHADEPLLAGMPDVVRDMHARSGLTEEVRRSTVTLREAEEQVLAYIREHVPDPRTTPLAVNSIKELCRRWFPRVFYAKPEKGLAHRALADIRESIRELDYYRRTLFVAPPGPTSGEAQAVAASLAPAPPPVGHADQAR